MGVPVMRTLGLVLAGDDGQHQLRYAGFGKGVSPGAFGHMGAHFQLAWADPATGVSLAYVNNLVADNMRHAGAVFPVADAAAES
jgi:CubicO group peptidase (beta-lactamase class C family)